MATKIAKVILAVVGLLFLIAGILPIINGQPVNTGSLSTAAVLLLLALVLRPRRPRASTPGPGA